jgi:hypothetical protein
LNQKELEFSGMVPCLEEFHRILLLSVATHGNYKLLILYLRVISNLLQCLARILSEESLNLPIFDEHFRIVFLHYASIANVFLRFEELPIVVYDEFFAVQANE